MDSSTSVIPAEIPEDAQVAASAALDAVEYARLAYTDIESSDVAEEAAKDLKSDTAALKRIEGIRFGITRPMNASLKAINDFFRGPENALKESIKIKRQGLSKYQHKQEQKRLEHEAKLKEQARKREEQLRKRAEAAKKKGNEEKAEALEEAASTVVAPAIPRAAAPQGISGRVTWSAEVVDKMELIKAVAAGTVPMVALDVNQKFLNQQATSLKDEFNIPGAKVHKKHGVVVR